MEASVLERKFNEAMVDIYERAKKEAKYNALKFLQLLVKYKGLETARILLIAPHYEGYTDLCQKGRPDLTVEHLVLQDPWRPLFSEEEIAIARERNSTAPHRPEPIFCRESECCAS